MKRSIIINLAAFAYAAAQNTTVDAYAASVTPYSLSIWTSDDCTTLSDTTITTTATMYTTYCSECEMMTMGGSTVHTTVYQTVGVDFCPNATSQSGTIAYLTPHTYTVTESCSMATPPWSTNASWVPTAAWVTETQVCSMCGEMGMTGDYLQIFA